MNHTVMTAEDMADAKRFKAFRAAICSEDEHFIEDMAVIIDALPDDVKLTPEKLNEAVDYAMACQRRTDELTD